MEVIKDSLANDENVYLRGFGSFTVKKRAAKTARNIGKNTTLIVPAHNIPASNRPIASRKLWRNNNKTTFSQISHNMNDKVTYWVEMSDYDFDTAKAMLATKRYLICCVHVPSGH